MKLRSEFYGQPHFMTHPHLLRNPNEVLMNISSFELEERRRAFLEKLPTGSAYLVDGNVLRMMSADIPYKFHQDKLMRP